ncbi:hypothetical protein [Methanohalophilus sp.]
MPVSRISILSNSVGIIPDIRFVILKRNKSNTRGNINGTSRNNRQQTPRTAAINAACGLSGSISFVSAQAKKIERADLPAHIIALLRCCPERI